MNVGDIWGAKEELKAAVGDVQKMMPGHNERVDFVRSFILDEYLNGVSRLTLEIRFEMSREFVDNYRLFNHEYIEHSHSALTYLKARCFKQFKEVSKFVQAVDDSLDVLGDDIIQMSISLGLGPLDLKLLRCGEYWKMTNFARMDNIFDLYQAMER